MCETIWVTFRISDIYFPEPPQVLMELHGKDFLKGKIVDVSDSGAEKDQYAVVEVEGLPRPVIVAMAHIEGVPRG